MISLCLDTDTTPTFHAQALLKWPSQWSGLTDSVWVQVYRVPVGWYVKSNVDLRGRWDQWCYSRPFASVDEAAQAAADLWAEGVRLALALTRGEPLRPPSMLMQEAWEASDEYQRLAGALGDAHQAISDLDVDHPAFSSRLREAQDIKNAAAEALARGKAAWWAGQDWRAYRDGLTTTGTPQKSAESANARVIRPGRRCSSTKVGDR